MKTALWSRYLAWAFLGVAALVLILSFVMICLHAASAWPWNAIVHEDGKTTLLGTIFYFEHATRELPVDLLLGVAIGGSALFAFSPERGAGKSERSWAIWFWLAVIVCLTILTGATLRVGPRVVIDNLLQLKTRPDAELEWGAHWRYHLLSRFALILISIGLAGVIRTFVRGPSERKARLGLVIVLGVVVAYGLLSLVFANGLASLGDPFSNPLYLGHEARELFTHALVTFPIGWGICMLLLPIPPAERMTQPLQLSGAIVGSLAAGVLGLIMGSYVCVEALLSKAVAHGQTTDLVTLVFPHFFEHSFTYLIVPITAVLVCRFALR